MKGYRRWNDHGKDKITLVMNHDELYRFWQTASKFTKLVSLKERQGQLPPNWNRHDREVIPGILKHIAPYEHGGEFLDPTEDQLTKHFKAIKKLSQQEGENITLEDYYDYIVGAQPHDYELNAKEMKDHCDERRIIKIHGTPDYSKPKIDLFGGV